MAVCLFAACASHVTRLDACDDELVEVGRRLPPRDPGTTTTVTVLIDGQFTPDERAKIEAALDMWEDAVPNLLLDDRRTVTHFSVLSDGAGVRIVRATGILDSSCWIGPGSIGRTYWRSWDTGRRAVVCLAPDHMSACVILHELGHGIGGLEHSENPDDIMFPNETDVSKPSRDDAARMYLAVPGVAAKHGAPLCHYA